MDSGVSRYGIDTIPDDRDWYSECDRICGSEMEWNDNCIARAHVSSLGMSIGGFFELVYGLVFLEGLECETWMEWNNKMEKKVMEMKVLFDFIVKVF